MSLRPVQEVVQLLVSDNSLWALNAPLDVLLSLCSGPHLINSRKRHLVLNSVLMRMCPSNLEQSDEAKCLRLLCASILSSEA